VLKLARILLLAVLSVSLAFLAAPSSAAEAVTTKPVTIKKIADQTVAPGKKAKVRPNVATSGRVTITRKRLTVKHGSKIIARNKASVSLKAGTYEVTTTVRYKTYVISGGKRKHSKTKSAKLAQTLKITTKSYPSRTGPVSEWNCPSWAPIKGNASSMIYHLPGQAFYTRTKPEDCFRTESAARDAGYRKSKV
jgi:hypothetical protein